MCLPQNAILRHRQAIRIAPPLSLSPSSDPSPFSSPSSTMRGCATLLLIPLFFTFALADPLLPPAAPEAAAPASLLSSSSPTALSSPAEALKTLPGPHPADPATQPGLSALEQARSEANTTADQVPGSGPVAKDDKVQDGDEDDAQGQPGEAFSAAQEAHNGSNAAAAPPVVRCADGVCVELGASLLSTVEGEQCRSLFVNGKCPAGCGQGIASVTGNESWPGCATACGNDVVSGAAERWREICEMRQETLIDQGKEVVKGLVADGLSTRVHWRAVVQFFLVVLLFVVGVGYGYRKGSAAQYAYRLQKRRLLGRKNSDNNLPI